MGNGRSANLIKSRNLKQKELEMEKRAETLDESTSSTGDSTGNSKTKTWDTLYSEAKSTTYENDASSLRQAMGMTGNEFNDIVLSSLSFATNCVLNGQPLPSYNTWSMKQINDANAKIEKLGKEFGRPLTGIRCVRADALSNFLNDPNINDNTIGKLIQTLKNDPSQLKAFGETMGKIDYTQKGHTAFGLNSTKGTPPSLTSDRPIRIETCVVPKVRGCVTHNSMENEVITVGNVKYNFLPYARITQIKDKTGKLRDQLVLRMYITP